MDFVVFSQMINSLKSHSTIFSGTHIIPDLLSSEIMAVGMFFEACLIVRLIIAIFIFARKRTPVVLSFRMLLQTLMAQCGAEITS
jgi:hypothetical protein